MAERLNRTSTEKARSMLTQSNADVRLWGEALVTANYLKNRSPTKVISGKTPKEVWSKQEPNLKKLRTFEENIFESYCENSKGYRVVHSRTKSLKRVRDVVFVENDFPSENMGKDIEFLDEATLSLDDQQYVRLIETTVEVRERTDREAEIMQDCC